MTLTNTEFREARKMLEKRTESDCIMFIDELGDFCQLKFSTQDIFCEDKVFIFGDEYTLTQDQKNILSQELEQDYNNYLIDTANAFSDDDKSHSISIMYS